MRNDRRLTGDCAEDRSPEKRGREDVFTREAGQDKRTRHGCRVTSMSAQGFFPHVFFCAFVSASRRRLTPLRDTAARIRRSAPLYGNPDSNSWLTTIDSARDRDDRAPGVTTAIPRFTTKVLRAVSRAGPNGPARGALGRSRPLRGARGRVAARLAGQSLSRQSRRVVIKTRLVNLKRAGPRSTPTHIRYLEREGVTRDGAPGQAYGAVDDVVDTHEFEERGREDRHQFRFIVSPEDGEDIGDLRAFTRQLMDQMERDLGTKLEWIAVDHWDTDNPHTHIVLRGKDDAGKDLIIAPDYISHGMQARARELATEWLGLRTEQEIRQSLIREVTQERWTSLDAQIARQVDLGRIDLSAAALARAGYDRSLLVGRLRHLATMGLAERVAADTWVMAPDTEHTLRTLSERGDIIRTMQRAHGAGAA